MKKDCGEQKSGYYRTATLKKGSIWESLPVHLFYGSDPPGQIFYKEISTDIYKEHLRLWTDLPLNDLKI